MNIADAIDLIATRLSAELPDNYQVYPHTPHQVTAPAVLITVEPGAYHAEDFEGGWTLNLAVVALLPHGSDPSAVQHQLWEHAQPTGPLSLRAILEDIDLDAIDDLDEITAVGFDAPGSYEVGGTAYAGVAVNVQVIAAS